MSIKINLKAAFAGAFTHPGPLLWFIGAAVVAPVILLSLGGQPNQLPWYFWALAVSLIVTVIGFGFWQFARKRRDGNDLSISPDRP